jgi:hypothetical protein
VTESRELRNKRIAIEAVNLLERAASAEGMRVQEWVRHELATFRGRWEKRGVPWLRPVTNYDPDEWLTAHEMAARADVEATTVRRWHLRGHITAHMLDGRLHYNVGEVNAYLAKRDRATKW